MSLVLRRFVWLLFVTSSLLGGGTFAEDARPGETQITANYGVYLAGFHFGDVRLTMALRGTAYQMKGEGRFSILGGLIYEWRGATTSSGKVGKSGPEPSLYTLSYSGGNKHSKLSITFGGGAVTQVLMSPKKRPNPHDIPVAKEQLRGVLDPMTGAFLHARPDLPNANLKICDETLPVFDGQMRFDIVLTPKRQTRVASETPDEYSGSAAVCGVRFVPIAGYRPDSPAIKFMASHEDAVEVWLVPLLTTGLYIPYRISVPTVVGSGSAKLIAFRVDRGQ